MLKLDIPRVVQKKLEHVAINFEALHSRGKKEGTDDRHVDASRRFA